MIPVVNDGVNTCALPLFFGMCRVSHGLCEVTVGRLNIFCDVWRQHTTHAECFFIPMLHVVFVLRSGRMESTPLLREWCAALPVDRGQSSLDAEMRRAASTAAQ